MSAAALWPARQVPTWHEPLRLMDGTPIRCGASRVTVNRSSLGEIAGYGMDKSHHALSWGAKLMLITTAGGVVAGFSLAHPKALDERKQALYLLRVHQIAGGPCPIVCDKGFAGAGIEKAAADLGHHLIRLTREDEPARALPFPGWLRQRIEAIIWTLKNQLGLQRHNTRPPDGLWARRPGSGELGPGLGKRHQDHPAHAPDRGHTAARGHRQLPIEVYRITTCG
ncbi:transposase [Nonomuraea sp. NPDC048881]|uniref:transposase n=1 Tax=Nonomuraea sp. NPDC048881 TaxID=3155030 RepID=UPI00340108D9